MARIEIHGLDGSSTRPLATSTLLGRSRACTWPLTGPRVPLYWVELRWVGRWAWRVLVGEDLTRGPGRVEPDGWRQLREGDQLQGPDDVVVRLVQGGPPEPFAVDLERHEVLLGEALDTVIEERGDGAWPLAAEHDLLRQSPLDDAEVFRTASRLLRYHAGQPPQRTERGRASLDSPDCELAIRLVADGPCSLQVLDGAEAVQLQGEFVRALVPYVEARRQDMPPGGWLELDAAHFRWQQLGGSAGSSRDRIAQDRSRLCRTLGREGVASAARLFETRRGPEGWVTRVVLPGDRLFID